jgi:hypothetical protein
MRASRFLALVAGTLAIAALWPLAAVFNWFGVNVGTLEQLGRTDPDGFRLVPSLIMFARPTVAGVAALLTLFAAVRVSTSPPTRAFGILMKAAAAQGLLALAVAASETPVNTTLARMLTMHIDRRTPGAFVAPGHFIGLQEAAAETIAPWLFAIALGSAVLALSARHAKVMLNVER